MQTRTGRASVPSMNPAAHTETPIRERADHRGDHAGARSPQRRRRGRLTSVLLALGLVALLVGCATASAAPTPTPTPTSLIAGLFATEDEALAAAKERYNEYSSLSESASDDASMERLREFVTAAQWEMELASSTSFQAQGLTTFGETVNSNFSLIDSGPSSLTIAFCADTSGARVLNASGDDITPSGQSERFSMQAVIDASDGVLRIADVSDSKVPSCEG